MNNPLVYLFSRTWRYGQNRGSIVTYWLMFIVGNTITMIASPLAMAKVIDIIQKQGITRENFSTLLILLLVTFIIHLAFWGFHGPARVIERANAFNVRANYRRSLLKGVLNLPLDWHTDRHSGDTIDRIEKGSTGLYSFSEGSFVIISSLVKLMVSYAMLIYVCPPAAYIVIAMIAVTVWITVRFDRVILGKYKELNQADNTISESVFDTISNITTVVILRVEKLVFSAISAKIDKPFGVFSQSAKVIEVKWFMTSTCNHIMFIAVLGVYFWQNIGTPQGVLIASVYLLLRYLDQIGELFLTFTGKYGDILRFKASVMNSEELAKDFVEQSFGNHVLPENWQCIQVKNLSFSYHTIEGADLHLENVDFTIRRGERIALVGKSGSGKTTLLKVMRGLYQPQKMQLAVDGRVVEEGFDGISRAIALVPQNPEIFATTIIDNITLGAEYPPEFVDHYVSMACFQETLLGLPNGYTSSINERGVNLSGGQQQRLALARGLLACHDKSLVLLDEPTSSLDFANEMRIYEKIFKEFRGKSIVSSIHRLHLLPLFDRIYMFDEGEVIGSGTLNELYASCPQFAELWKKYRQQEGN